MKSITQYIIERGEAPIHPKDKKELQEIILKLHKQQGDDVDLSNIDTSNITDMSELFYNEKLSKIKGKGLENWDVSNVVDMSYMFYRCINLECDLSNWDVSNVKDMEYMFNGCGKFEGKILDVWDIRRLKKYFNAFHHCNSKPKWYKP